MENFVISVNAILPMFLVMALGYGARLLQPIFARPSAWRVLDAIIALVMASIAASLLIGL